MDQKKVILILADIGGYTQFMLESQTAAVHGQVVINGLIESILTQVDIPLTLQEIEGDAVFLYAAHPGADADWDSVVEQVSRKLGKFFEAFIGQLGIAVEATPCPCAICRNAEKLGLKIVVHSGEAMFHEIAGRAQVSGSDVILAHRLLKNTVSASFYLLLSDAAYAAMGAHLPGSFARHQETYDGFGTVTLRVRDLTGDVLSARDSVYALDETGLKAAIRGYGDATRPSHMITATLQQLRNPVRRFSWLEKISMLLESVVVFPVVSVLYRWLALPRLLRTRGQRRVR